MADRVVVYHGDCLDVLRTMPDNSVHAVVTDPPYNLAFMGRGWDTHDSPRAFQAWCELWAVECLRVLTPGGHLLAFGGTRTGHRLVAGVEDAGFEVRDSIAWLYGSGFPKSLDVGKAIDKAGDRVGGAVVDLKVQLRARFDASGLSRSEVDARCGFRAANYLTLPAEGKRPDPWVGVLPSPEKWAVMRDVLGCGPELDGLFARAEREVIGRRRVVPGVAFTTTGPTEIDVTIPRTPAAREWAGWGTALKPAFEPIVVARKPLAEGTVAGNVQEWGTGALNIDACRVATNGETLSGGTGTQGKHEGWDRPWMHDGANREGYRSTGGRWPANVALDGSQADALDQQSGVSRSVESRRGPRTGVWRMDGCSTLEELQALAAEGAKTPYGRDAATTLARFLERDRDDVRGHADEGGASRFFPTFRYQAKAPTTERPSYVTADGRKISHPTVKPLALMRWLIRLITPPGGTILDPFAGSGATLEAALIEGFPCIGIELDPDSLPLIQQRIDRQAGTLNFGEGEPA